MKYKIGVMGKASRGEKISQDLVEKAKKTGEEIAQQNCILVTGACMGVSYEAAKSCGEKGGEVLAYSPSSDLKSHIEPPISYPYPPAGCKLIFTGMGKVGRNVLSIKESDGVIIIGGGMGTTNEFSIAAHEGKVIGILKGTKGAADELLELFKKIGGKKNAVVVADYNPKKLVEKVIQKIKEKEEYLKPSNEIPISFKNQNGKQLIGIFHLPLRVYKPPLVILVHGFGGSKTKISFVRLARALVKEKIAVFRFDFEGCGDSQGDLENTTIQKQILDLNSAIKAILKEADIDGTRIAFVAESLGTVVAALFKNQFSFPLKTMVFWAPAFCQKKLFQVWHTPVELENWRKKGYITRKDKKIGVEYLRENENEDYSRALSRIDLPILILHGKKDETVPIKFSENLAKKFKNLKLIKLSSGHKFEDYTDQGKLIRETIRWVKKYI